MPSIFRSRNATTAATPKRQKLKPKAGEAKQTADAFLDDPELQQLHAETAELLRLVKSPTPTQARGASSGAGSASPSVTRKRRVTIEVLDIADEDDDGGFNGEAKAQGSSRPTDSPPSKATERATGAGFDAYGGATTTSDPFDFAAEEARVRKAADTFYPDMSPTKRGLTVQRDVFEKEQARLEELARREEETQARRRAALTKGFAAANRLEMNAVKIQAHCRGYLLRKKHNGLERKQVTRDVESNGLVSPPGTVAGDPAADQWHEVRDVEKGETWYYNAHTGQSQWERPPNFRAPRPTGAQSLPELHGRRSSNTGLGPETVSSNSSGPEATAGARAVSTRVDASYLPPLSPTSSACMSARSVEDGQQRRKASSDYSNNAGSSSSIPKSLSANTSAGTGSKSTSMLPALRPDYASLSQPPWECDSIASERSGLPSDRWCDDDSVGSATVDTIDRRRSQDTVAGEDFADEGNDDWQVNDTLFRADGTRNSKLRDTIRQALQVSKFDSISSLLASNVVLRKKSMRRVRGSGTGDGDQSLSPARGRASDNQSSGKRAIVLGKRDAPFLVAVLADSSVGGSPTRPKSTSKAKARAGGATINKNPLANPPGIRDLADPGFLDDDVRASTPTRTLPDGRASQQQEEEGNGEHSPARKGKTVCFNCWSSSSGTYCELHTDPRMATRKVKAGASALMCANWELDQLRRKYRAEEIQEIFMKQNASLRYDRQRKTYVTVVECRHPIYRTVEQLATAWNKTMRRKMHTRAWFRSFIEQLRAGQVPKADSSTPALMKLKSTLQNNCWCTKYSNSVRNFHPKAPVTAKTYKSDHSTAPVFDVITIDPGHPQLRNWILKTDCTKPVMLYRPRKYDLPPRRCVPMPTPSFLEDVPLPVPNVFIDCDHIASWFERLAARVSKAALDKATLQVAACSPPAGVTRARRTKVVRPVTVMFATFGRKPTRGNLAVGGLSAELLIHMLVTTYVPAQFGYFVVFDRRAIAPSLSKDHDAVFACLAVALDAPAFVLRALEHALNVRRPPGVVIATRVSPGETEYNALYTDRRFPVNRVEQTGEELAMGFRTFWLVDARPVHEEGISSVQVAPSSDILSLNATSMNPASTTRADRHYPFCIPTTRENTPIEFIHLLWIGQSSRNQPQVFTALGAQQPGDFMKNSDPDGALGLCTSVVYRSWAYFQMDNPYEEFVTEDGVAYWYDKRSGETFWLRPMLPAEKYRGKDGDVDGVVAEGVGERATLGVGAEESRYSTQSVRKFITKGMEAPEEVERRRRLVAASAKKHDIVVELSPRSNHNEQKGITSQRKDLPRIQVPNLYFQSKQQQKAAAASTDTGVRFQGPKSDNNSAVSVRSPTKRQQQQSQAPAVDDNTKQLIDSITQALGSAFPSLGAATGASGSVEMLQFGIGLGMGLGLRVQQQQQQPQPQQPSNGLDQELPTIRSDEGNEDDSIDGLVTSRSDTSSVDSSLTARSTISTATSVDISPSPDEIELAGGASTGASSPSKTPPGYGEKTPGYNTHPPPGEGTTWVRKPVDSSGDSQTAVDGFSGALHQRVACLPKGFVAAVSSTKTCKMQANYLPIVKNMNQPRNVGIVRPRAALEEWLTVGYSPWSAGRAIFGSEFIDNLMRRPELLQQAASADVTAVAGVSKVVQSALPPTQVTVEKRDNVSQAGRESQSLEAIMSLCRHGKYDELEVMLNNPDWTLNIDAMDATGNTLLSVACQNNNKRIAKLCLRRGADINTQNLNGQSVLHYCHEYGFHDLMEYLMDKGARDDLLNADGLTCYEGLSKEAVDAL